MSDRVSRVHVPKYIGTKKIVSPSGTRIPPKKVTTKAAPVRKSPKR